MQIKERKFAALFESDDFAIDNQVGRELLRSIGYFRELICNSLQIAREDLDPFVIAMKLRANAVKFVFHIKCRGGIWPRFFLFQAAGSGFYIKPFPNRLRGWFRTGQHRFNRPKNRQFCPIKLITRGEQCGGSNVAQQHVRFFNRIQ